MKAEELKILWRESEALYCEKPEEVIGEGPASFAVKTPELKRSWKDTEA